MSLLAALAEQGGAGVGPSGGRTALLRPAVELASPPPTDRGVENTNEHGVHSTTLTIWAHREWCLYALEQLLFGVMAWNVIPGRGRGFSSIEQHVTGVKLYSSASLPYCSVEIPGSAADKLDFERLRYWYVWIREQGVRLRFSRADIFFDGVPFTPAMAYDAWKRGDVLTRARRDSYRWIESGEGNSFYCGKRDSERFLRIYDKRGFTRIELELSGERADMVMWQIIEASDVPSEMLSHIRAFIDFVDCESDSNRSRAAFLTWWSEFVENAVKSPLKLPVLERTIKEIKHYIEQTWSAMFTTINDCEPSEMFAWVANLIDSGRSKQRAKHHRLVALASMA